MSCDGQNDYTLPPGGEIIIKKKHQKLKLIHPIDYNYYSVCRTKLGWESRLGVDND